MRPALSIKNVSKSYKVNKNVLALREISFDISQGELFGLIGPDGAGKTSLFRIAASLLLPDEGEVELDGINVLKNPSAVRRRIGYMPGKFSLYHDLSVDENIRFFASLFNIRPEQNRHLIHDIYSQLEPFRKRRAGKLSGGMKQKLALCCALIHKPSVLLLDEPTTGVDPVSRQEFWDMLRRLQNEGITIMVSTPYMDEAAACDRISFIQEGRIMRTDTPDAITASYPYPLFAIKGVRSQAALQAIRTWPFTRSCYAFGDSLHLATKEDTTPEKITGLLSANGYPHATTHPVKPGIEDSFIAYQS